MVLEVVSVFLFLTRLPTDLGHFSIYISKLSFNHCEQLRIPVRFFFHAAINHVVGGLLFFHGQ
jgi:hypothetical protein